MHADRDAVSTIVRNLLVNACKYAHGAAQHWTTAVEAGWAKIEVRDAGPGIPAADLPHVFERFYRGEKTRAREEGGSGLGLSIVQGLARAQGGDVAIRSAEASGDDRDRLAPACARPAAAPYRLNGDWNDRPLSTVSCPVAMSRPKTKRIAPATMLITRR